MHPPSTQFLLWLLNYDLASQKHAFLRILHLSSLPSDDHEELAMRCGPHLHSLRIPHADRELIGSSRRLKEVFMFNGDGVTVDFLLTLPPSIEHIAFGFLQGVQALTCVFQVKGSEMGLENLRVVSLYRHVNQQWPGEWPTLLTLAKSIGVRLVRQENRGFLVGGVCVQLHGL